MFRVFWGVPGFLAGVPGFLGLFLVFLGVPGFSGVPECFVMFRCSGVPCSGVPGSTTCPSQCLFELRTVFNLKHMLFGSRGVYLLYSVPSFITSQNFDCFDAKIP